MRILVCLVSILMAGCGPQVITRDRVKTANIAVAQPCVEGERPEEVVPLKERTPDWVNARDKTDLLGNEGPDIRQKAAMVGQAAEGHMKYGEDLNAATGGCP